MPDFAYIARDVKGQKVTGSLAALSAIRVLLEGRAALGDPQWGRLHLLEGLVPGLRSFTVAKDPECRGCSPRG